MKENTRNVAVGVTVIVALVMFGGMVLMFTGLPEVLQGGRVIRMNFPATADVQTGEWVHLAGMRVGKITDITFADDDPRKGVQLVARIDEGVKVPADVRPMIYSRGFVGGAYVTLAQGGPQRFDPATGEKLVFLPEDWPEPLTGELKGSGLIPKEMIDAIRGLGTFVEKLNGLISAGAAATGPATGPAATQPTTAPAAATLQGTLAKLDRTLDALGTVLGDTENQANIKKTVANLAIASEKAADAMDALKEFSQEATKTTDDVRSTISEARLTVTRAGKAIGKIGTLADSADRHVGELSAKLIEDAEKLSALLASMNRVITKLDDGKGSAGQLLNDPELYKGLVEATAQLASLLKEFRGVVAQWKKEGALPLKFK